MNNYVKFMIKTLGIYFSLMIALNAQDDLTMKIREFETQGSALFFDNAISPNEKIKKLKALADGQSDVIKAMAMLYAINVAGENHLFDEAIALKQELLAIPTTDERIKAMKKLLVGLDEQIAKIKIAEKSPVFGKDIDDWAKAQFLLDLTRYEKYSIKQLTEAILTITDKILRQKIALMIIEGLHYGRQKIPYKNLTTIAEAGLSIPASPTPTVDHWGIMYLQRLSENKIDKVALSLKTKIWGLDNFTDEEQLRHHITDKIFKEEIRPNAKSYPLFPLLTAQEMANRRKVATQSLIAAINNIVIPRNDIIDRGCEILRNTAGEFTVNGKLYTGLEVARRIWLKRIIIERDDEFFGHKNHRDFLFIFFDACLDAPRLLNNQHDRRARRQAGQHSDPYMYNDNGKKKNVYDWLLKEQLTFIPDELANTEYGKKLNQKSIKTDDVKNKSLPQMNNDNLLKQALQKIMGDDLTDDELTQITPLLPELPLTFYLEDLPAFVYKYDDREDKYSAQELTTLPPLPENNVFDRALMLLKETPMCIRDKRWRYDGEMLSGKTIAAQMTVLRLLLAKRKSYRGQMFKMLFEVSHTLSAVSSLFSLSLEYTCFLPPEGKKHYLFQWLLTQLSLTPEEIEQAKAQGFADYLTADEPK